MSTALYCQRGIRLAVGSRSPACRERHSARIHQMAPRGDGTVASRSCHSAVGINSATAGRVRQPLGDFQTRSAASSSCRVLRSSHDSCSVSSVPKPADQQRNLMATGASVKPFHRLQDASERKVQTSYSGSLDNLRKTFASGRTKTLEWRVQQLRQLERFVLDNYDDFLKALDHDLHKSRMESVTFELDFVLNDIRGALMEVDGWMKPEYAPKTLMTAMDTPYVHNEPYGLALVLGAWNYPVQVTLCPLIGAISAGNCTVVKPSELTPLVAQLYLRMMQYLDKEAFLVINGGVDVATELLKERFDVIFYTGSVNVGKIVYAAAQPYLTPVILELGGKSPAYVHSDVDLDIAVHRILWGKFVNAGQTCVAPDYVMCHSKVYDQFISASRKVVREFFGEDPKQSKDFGRIVTSRHADRLVGLLRDCPKDNIIVGGDSDTANQYVSPTIVKDVQPTDAIMQEEIFGPILPIMKVDSLDDAVRFINSHDKPLAAYPFARDQNILRRFINETSSGSVCANDTLVHLSVEALPFGGVGNSGMGRYHGKHSFDAFSNKRAVLQRDFSWIGEAVSSKRYPPCTEGSIKFFKFLLARRANPFRAISGIISPLFWVAVGILLSSVFKIAIPK